MLRCRTFTAIVVSCCWILGGLEPATAQGPPRALPANSVTYSSTPSTPLSYRSASPTDRNAGAFVDGPLSNGPMGNGLNRSALDVGVLMGQPGFSVDYWEWQLLPETLLYPAYLAGGRESRFASQWIREQQRGWLWDVALGGHVGIWRYGNCSACRPEGWQLDIEGAGFPRLALGSARELVSVDFRFGIPLTFRRGRWETKFGYYHLSSHLGDEYMVGEQTLDRINYSRDVIIAGAALRPSANLRLYAETGWAFLADGGSKPWEFQFGIDYSPSAPTRVFGAPFFAVNTRLREEVDFGGNVTAQAGLQWRGETGRLLRTGLHYFNGKSDQYQFFKEHEEQFGFGMWYDF
jgi:hypothetical protein